MRWKDNIFFDRVRAARKGNDGMESRANKKTKRPCVHTGACISKRNDYFLVAFAGAGFALTVAVFFAGAVVFFAGVDCVAMNGCCLIGC